MPRPDDRSVYETLVERHAASLYRLAYRLVGETAGAEDLVQESFLQAWRSIRSLREVDAGSAWLTTILRRRFGRWLHDRSRQPRVAADSDADDTASPLPGPDAGMFSDHERLQRALDHLDPRLKEPLLLSQMAGLSCGETARLLSLPLGTVLSRIHRARVELRRRLEPRSVDDVRDSGSPKSGRGGAT
jgi:RNA polymerase sigma-70 factor (ECF subfamily)